MRLNPDIVAKLADRIPRNPIRGLDLTESAMLEANTQNRTIAMMLITVRKFIMIYEFNYFLNLCKKMYISDNNIGATKI